MAKVKDLTGQIFGKLTVIKRVNNKILPSGYPQTMWECQCECGNKTIVMGSNLKRGFCKSCGCASTQRKKQNKNIYDLSGEYGVGYTSKGEEFYFDLEDYDKIKDYTWYIKKGYVVTTVNQTNTKILFHRLVMNVVNNPNVIIDHIHHNKSDNRKSQLRVATNQQNQFNSLKAKNNTSGVTGVYWHKKFKKWESIINYNNKQIYLGLYDNFDDAVKTRKEAEIRYFGDYRYQENINSVLKIHKHK